MTNYPEGAWEYFERADMERQTSCNLDCESCKLTQCVDDVDNGPWFRPVDDEGNVIREEDYE